MGTGRNSTPGLRAGHHPVWRQRGRHMLVRAGADRLYSRPIHGAAVCRISARQLFAALRRRSAASPAIPRVVVAGCSAARTRRRGRGCFALRGRRIACGGHVAPRGQGLLRREARPGRERARAEHEVSRRRYAATSVIERPYIMPDDTHARQEISSHYESGYEAQRLAQGTSRLELARTQELLERFLPPPPAVVLDVGGGPGVYAIWLAQKGYA